MRSVSNHSLTDEQVQSYRREGYLVVPSLFGAEDLRKADQTIRDITKTAMAAGDYSKVLEIEPQKVDGEHVPRRIYNPFEQHEHFRAMGTDARLLDCVAALIGPDIAIQHSKLNMKPAKVGSVVDWHQDLAYFPHTNDDVVTTLIYLDDATEKNGCLQVIPRHHHHFFNHISPDGTFAGMITEDLDSGSFGKPLALEAPAGSAIFMHCITPHSSLPNRSDKARRTLIFEYRAADSFPIYCGLKTVDDEALVHHLRGKPAQFARFGGPPPYVPQMPKTVKSLYQLQEKTKAEAAKAAKTVAA